LLIAGVTPSFDSTESEEETMEGVEIIGAMSPAVEEVLKPEALAFVVDLHRRFNPQRDALLKRRAERQVEIDGGKKPDFLPETRHIRESAWSVAPTPPDLQDRRAEITGPCDRRMMINALNCGAKVFMSDLEDSLSPSWVNVIQGQINLRDAVRRTISFDTPEGRQYRLNEEIAVLLLRPRGWHLPEKHVLVDGEKIGASFFDFGLYFFHNAQELLSRGSGPYFYLPKIESHLEARLWNDVFNHAQDALGIPRGTIRATVLIETILAAFEMDEILYELRDHSGGLNAGRWDYIFSCIKKFRDHDVLLPDRVQITMTVPFMRAYTELLVSTCHKRGAHAIGGMAAFIPSRRDPEVNKVALERVKADKDREANDGFDGSWLAHPDLVPVAIESFNAVLGERPNQKERLREDVRVTGSQLIDFNIPGGQVTREGFRMNVDVALQYINSWLMGNGAAAIYNLMEDAATAEISRGQLGQWINGGATLEDGTPCTLDLYREVRASEVEKHGGMDSMRFGDAARLLDSLVFAEHFAEFLTLPAYGSLE
jgi:malate synthase